MSPPEAELEGIQRAVINCRACPRLVAHRERVADQKTRRFADHSYWGRPVPSLGDPQAALLIVGLAPAAHGANRTGRMFTGDRSGDWLFEALHRFGFANQPISEARGDGLELDGAYISAVARCAPPGNRPSRQELENCRGYLLRELAALPQLQVVLALGKIAHDGFLEAWADYCGQRFRPRPKFGHQAELELQGGLRLLASYHPSQQNTFTGRLTRPMFHSVFERIQQLIG